MSLGEEEKLAKRKRYIPYEHDEQVAFVKWLKIMKINHYSIPNSSALSSLNRNTGKKVGWMLKQEGLRKGASDLVVMLDCCIVYIEMKRRDKSLSRPTSEQIEFIEMVNGYNYAFGYIVYGWLQAKDIIEKHIKG